MKKIKFIFSKMTLPIVILLTLITLMWQKVDEYNTSVEKANVVQQQKANNQYWGYECGFGRIPVNKHTQTFSIIALFVVLIVAIRTKKILYGLIGLTLLIVFSGNLIMNIFWLEINSFNKNLGFHSKSFSLPDVILYLLFPILFLLILPKFYHFAKSLFQAKIFIK